MKLTEGFFWIVVALLILWAGDGQAATQQERLAYLSALRISTPVEDSRYEGITKQYKELSDKLLKGEKQ